MLLAFTGSLWRIPGCVSDTWPEGGSAWLPVAPGRPRARSHDELGFYRQHRPAPAIAGDAVQQQVQGALAELTEILAHRRQRRQEERGLGHVVESHHADVAGHA